MISLIDRAFEVVKSEGPNAKLIAELGCELEQTRAKNFRLEAENKNVRRSYKKLKVWFTRQFKYYKAHRDELLNENNNQVDSSILRKQVAACNQESRIRYRGRSNKVVSLKQTN